MSLRPVLGLQGVRRLQPSAMAAVRAVPTQRRMLLSTHSRRPRIASTPVPRPQCGARRTLITEALESLSSAVGATPLPGFIAAAPTPLWATIILATVLVRGGITLPFQLWQRRRVARTREFIVPQMKQINDELAVSLIRESRREGLSYEEYRARLKDELATRQAALHRKYGTHPLTTFLVPLVVSVPVFVVMSMSIRQAVLGHPELAAQSFLWIQHFGQPDPMWVLPMVCGLLGYTNAEVADKRHEYRKRIAQGQISDVSPEDEAAADAKARAAAAEPPLAASVSSTAATPGTHPTTAAKRPEAPGAAPLSPHLRDSQRKLSTTGAAAAKRRAGPAARSQIPFRRPGTPLRPGMPGGNPLGSPPKVFVEEKSRTASLLLKDRDIVQKMLSTLLRGSGLLIIILGMDMPAAVVWYWTCSMSWTLAQNWFLPDIVKQAPSTQTSETAKA